MDIPETEPHRSITRIDTRDAKRVHAQDHTPGVGVEMELEDRDKSIGKLYHYKLHSSLPEWSPNIRWINTDFLTATNSLVGTATANFSMRNPLTRELKMNLGIRNSCSNSVRELDR